MFLYIEAVKKVYISVYLFKTTYCLFRGENVSVNIIKLLIRFLVNCVLFVIINMSCFCVLLPHVMEMT